MLSLFYVQQFPSFFSPVAYFCEHLPFLLADFVSSLLVPKCCFCALVRQGNLGMYFRCFVFRRASFDSTAVPSKRKAQTEGEDTEEDVEEPKVSVITC